MNKVILRGHVGHNPKVTTFPDGGKVATFSFATTERGFTTKDGKKIEEKTTWHNIKASGKGLAGIIEKYVVKGDSLLIVGKIENRKYQGKDGADKYITEIVVEDVEMLSGKKSENTQGTDDSVKVITNIVDTEVQDVEETNDLPF